MRLVSRSSVRLRLWWPPPPTFLLRVLSLVPISPMKSITLYSHVSKSAPPLAICLQSNISAYTSRIWGFYWVWICPFLYLLFHFIYSQYQPLIMKCPKSLSHADLIPMHKASERHTITRKSKVPMVTRHPLLSNHLHIMKPKEDDGIWMMHWSNEEAASCWFSSAPPWSGALTSQEAVHFQQQSMLQLQLSTHGDYRAISVLISHSQAISSFFQHMWFFLIQ